MEEQSHKSEMRAALRGDFERLRARRQSGTSEVVAEPFGPDTQAAEPPVAAPASPEPDPTPRSWLDRLRGLR